MEDAAGPAFEEGSTKTCGFEAEISWVENPEKPAAGMDPDAALKPCAAAR